MCRLVVWNKDPEPTSDPRLAAGRYEKGMVISVLDDGVHPGTGVLGQERFLVIDLPGVPTRDMEYLTHIQPADVDPAKLPRKRWSVLNTTALVPNKDNVVTSQKTIIEATRRLATYITDTSIIGEDPRIIG